MFDSYENVCFNSCIDQFGAAEREREREVKFNAFKLDCAKRCGNFGISNLP